MSSHGRTYDAVNALDRCQAICRLIEPFVHDSRARCVMTTSTPTPVLTIVWEWHGGGYMRSFTEGMLEADLHAIASTITRNALQETRR